MTAEANVEELAALVNNGDVLGLPTSTGDYAACSMVATRALIRRGLKDLNLVLVPSSGIQADMLIGAGCVRSIQNGVISLSEYGAAPRYVDAQRRGRILVKESTCPAIEAALTAAERGLPFMPVRGILGSDIVRLRANEWMVIDNPYPPGDPILLVPAIKPDVALIHAPLADRFGNIWIGRNGHARVLSHAAKMTLATFERWYEGNLFDDPVRASGVLPAQYVRAISHQPRGAWPLGFGDEYPEDAEEMRTYAERAKTDEGFASYLRERVHDVAEVV